MFEETRKYTEETYRTKDELAEELELEGVVLEAVWMQIEEYRSLFRREFNFTIFFRKSCPDSHLLQKAAAYK